VPTESAFFKFPFGGGGGKPQPGSPLLGCTLFDVVNRYHRIQNLPT